MGWSFFTSTSWLLPFYQKAAPSGKPRRLIEGRAD